MQRFIIGSLSSLALSLVAAPVLANEIAATSTAPMHNVVEVTPFNLVSHGYQGYFVNQGIPGNAAFIAAVKSGRIDATNLVESAVARGRLSPETLSNQAYLHAVESFLDNLDRN
ncbi:hypothetical protein IQ238_16385 [Pleurocapsales cyanobacterium LEGE 06147]|nr:hypothetical protein [Pleurocapsales cyanobacterium LEGE 06147]